MPPSAPLIGVQATFEIVEPPQVDHLYFWALQASFGDGRRSHGGAHLGLQWNNRHPGNTAANWGGYHHSGRILDGSTVATSLDAGRPEHPRLPMASQEPVPIPDHPGDRRMAG